MSGALKIFFAELTGDDATLQAALHELGATIGRVAFPQPSSPQLDSLDLRTVDPMLTGSSPVGQLSSLAGETATTDMGGGDIPSMEDPAASTSDGAGDAYAGRTWTRRAKPATGGKRRGRKPKAAAVAVVEKPARRPRNVPAAKKSPRPAADPVAGDEGRSPHGLTPTQQKAVAWLQENSGPHRKSAVLEAIGAGKSTAAYLFKHEAFTSAGYGLVELASDPPSPTRARAAAPLRTPAATPTATRQPSAAQREWNGSPAAAKETAVAITPSALAIARDTIAAELSLQSPLTVSKLVKLTSFPDALIRDALKDDRFETEAGGWQLAEGL